MPKLSALIITYNEIHHISEVIDTISFVDEIIVIDSYSNDGTFEYLSNISHVKTIQRDFKNFADQRNFAITQATNDWILFIDADERIPKTLELEIKNEIHSPDGTAGFMFKRTLFFNKKKIRFSGFQTDTTYRLFKRNHVKYKEDKIVHEMPEIDGTSKVLKNKMLHYSIKNAQDYRVKMEHYASLKALELFNKGKKSSYFLLVFRPIYKFLVNYIFRLGFLDGKEGFQLCYLSACGVFYRYRRLQELVKSS